MKKKDRSVASGKGEEVKSSRIVMNMSESFLLISHEREEAATESIPAPTPEEAVNEIMRKLLSNKQLES